MRTLDQDRQNFVTSLAIGTLPASPETDHGASMENAVSVCRYLGHKQVANDVVTWVGLRRSARITLRRLADCDRE